MNQFRGLILLLTLFLPTLTQAATPCKYEQYVTEMVQSGGLCQENVRRLGMRPQDNIMCQDMERLRGLALRERKQQWCATVVLTGRVQQHVDWLNDDLSDISGGRHLDILSR